MKMQHFIFSTLFFLLAFHLCGQEKEFVKSDSISYPIHQANRGKIVFMGQVIPIENFKESDFLTSFELKEKTDFNIRVFLARSLTNDLHALSPSSTAEELNLNGNFQFTFWVDGTKTYTENLHHGAFGPENKNARTVFRVPFISSSNEDSWGRFLWNRFLISGGQEAFTSGEHVLKVEIRPYLNLAGLKVGNILAEGQIKIIAPEKKIKEKLVKIQSIKPLKDWTVSTATYDAGKIEALNRKIASETYKDITSIVVIKDGQLLIEEYFNGADRNTLHDTRSVGKSFASTLLGIAIGEGHIKNETQLLNTFFDLKKYQNPSAYKDQISLKSLLTMSSAFKGSDMDPSSPGNEENMYPAKNWVEFTLNLPIDSAKSVEARWDYFTAGVVVLGDILHRSVPGGLEAYAAQKLFQPLGITRYKWQYTPQKVANTAGGLQMRSLDYAKYGQLYKNQGIWQNQPILSADWVKQTFSRQATVSDQEFYGYLFWNKTYQVDGKNYEVDYSSGNGGNKIFIFKNQPLVIVITATAYNKPYGHVQIDRMMSQYLIPALVQGF